MFKKVSALFLVFLCIGCSDETLLGTGETLVTRCAIDEKDASPLRLVFGESGEAYILNEFSLVYRYNRDPSRLCAFELDREFSSFGSLRLPGFAEEIDYYGYSLFYHDGISLRKAEDESFECTLAKNLFAIENGKIITGENSLEQLELTSKGCSSLNVDFPGALRILAVAASSGKVATVESVTGFASNPERLVVYSTESSSTPFRHALSDVESSETYFCSATKLLFFNSGILLFDKECEKLGVFDREGYFINSIQLQDFKIRAPIDMAVFDNEVYFLTKNSFDFGYKLEISDLLR